MMDRTREMDRLHEARELAEGLSEIMIGLIESPSEIDKALCVVSRVVDAIEDDLKAAEAYALSAIR